MQSRMTWLSGFFGAVAAVHAGKVLFGLDFAIPQLGFVLTTPMSAAIALVSGIIAYACWRRASTHKSPHTKRTA